jgi:hypothetical protein
MPSPPHDLSCCCPRCLSADLVRVMHAPMCACGPCSSARISAEARRYAEERRYAAARREELRGKWSAFFEGETSTPTVKKAQPGTRAAILARYGSRR